MNKFVQVSSHWEENKLVMIFEPKSGRGKKQIHTRELKDGELILVSKSIG